LDIKIVYSQRTIKEDNEMPYKYNPGTANKYRIKKGYQGAGWLTPGAWKAQLGEAWFPGAEDFYNRGLVEDIDELKAQISNKEGRQGLLSQAEKQDRTFGDKIKNWFTTSPWALITPAGIIAQAVSEGETPLKRGFQKVKEEITKQPPEEEIKAKQREFINEMLGIAQKGIPQQIERLEQQRQTPYLEQAFGPVGGQVAGGLGATLLSQLAQSPGSEFTSGEFQSTNPLSGQLLGSLLSSLAVQGGSQYGPGLYEQYGPQLQQYGQQGLQYGKQKGQSALDYLRGLVPQR
jgi:hypothetical protein